MTDVIDFTARRAAALRAAKAARRRRRRNETAAVVSPADWVANPPTPRLGRLYCQRRLPLGLDTLKPKVPSATEAAALVALLLRRDNSVMLRHADLRFLELLDLSLATSAYVRKRSLIRVMAIADRLRAWYAEDRPDGWQPEPAAG